LLGLKPDVAIYAVTIVAKDLLDGTEDEMGYFMIGYCLTNFSYFYGRQGLTYPGVPIFFRDVFV